MKPKSFRFHLGDSIAARLLKVVFSIYLVISIALTALHMTTEYMKTKQEVRREVEALHQIIRLGLTNAFYDADLFQVQDILEGMASSPSIIGCKLDDSMGNTVEKSGTIPESPPPDLDVGPGDAGYHEDKATGLFVYAFPIIHSYVAQKIRMGTLYVYSGSGVIFQKVKYGFLLIIVNAVIKTVALWIIFLYFSRIMLGRPLGILTAAANRLRLDRLEDFEVDVRTRGRNELKILEDAFKSMVRKLRDAHMELRNYANELDRSNRQLDDIVNNSPAVIFVKDTAGRYMLVNREYERIFHVTRDRVLGKTDRDIFAEDAVGIIMAGDQEAITGNKPVEMEENIPLIDGVRTYISVKFPLHDAQNDVYGVCGIATDISERIAAEKILKDYNDNLKQEVEQRTCELRRANLSLEQNQALLERLAVMDGLTEIPNRRHFDEVLEKEWRRAQRTENPVALIMMDIDCFKGFNDRYGHPSGDECLRKVARALSNSLGRASDFIARYGGEEFAAILPGASTESVAEIAEKMRADIEALNIPHAASEVADHVTLSMGTALFVPTAETSPCDLIETADNALYQAKKNGRNQVVPGKGLRAYLKKRRIA